MNIFAALGMTLAAAAIGHSLGYVVARVHRYGWSMRRSPEAQRQIDNLTDNILQQFKKGRQNGN